MYAGRTSVSVVRVASTASGGMVPSGRNDSSRWRKLPVTRLSPTTPVQMIITAAYTVSRARAAAAVPPESIIATINDASITVTASARINVPKGSPTRSAITSAWCTATSTAAMSATPAHDSSSQPGEPPQVTASITQAASGTATDQAGRPPNISRFIAAPHPWSYQVRDRLAHCRPKAYPTRIPARACRCFESCRRIEHQCAGRTSNLFHYPGVRSDSVAMDWAPTRTCRCENRRAMRCCNLQRPHTCSPRRGRCSRRPAGDTACELLTSRGSNRPRCDYCNAVSRINI